MKAGPAILLTLWLGACASPEQHPHDGGGPERWAGLLQSRDADTRLEAARALEQLGSASRPWADELIEALDDPDSRVRLRSLHALRASGAGANEVYQQALNDPSPEVCVAAARALIAAGEPQARFRELLCQAYESGDRGARFAATRAFGEQGQVDALVFILTHERDWAVHAEATRWLTAAGGDAESELLRAYDSHGARARERVAMHFVGSPSPSVCVRRALLVGQFDPDGRAAGAGARAYMNGPAMSVHPQEGSACSPTRAAILARDPE